MVRVLKLASLAIAILVVSYFAFVIVVTYLTRRAALSSGHGAEPQQTLHTLATAEITYATMYPSVGYAPNLAALGPSRDCGAVQEALHACLLDAGTGCEQGIGQQWCIHGRFRYNVQSSSSKPPFSDFWVTAIPLERGPELRNFCYTNNPWSMRSEPSVLRTKPLTLEEFLALPKDEMTYHDH